jgi:para-aminobenzoate synthetase component 2
MAVRHRSAPLVGVQFHPESVLTESGRRLLGNWLREVRSGGASVSADDTPGLSIPAR